MSVTKTESLSTQTGASRQSSIDLIEEQKEERVVEVDFRNTHFIPLQEYDVEMEYGETSFPVGDEKPLRANQRLQLGYTETEGVVEIIGWGLQADLGEACELPRLVGRRFLDLFSKSLIGEFTEQEEACFTKICEQVDYRSFCQNREMPRYREATLVRKPSGVFVEFLSEKTKLNQELADQLRVLENNQRIGAWFAVDSDGEIIAIKSVLTLPSIDNSEELLSEIPNVADDEEVPEFIREKLNKKRDGQK